MSLTILTKVLPILRIIRHWIARSKYPPLIVKTYRIRQWGIHGMLCNCKPSMHAFKLLAQLAGLEERGSIRAKITSHVVVAST